jgi:hypothetical protein
MIRTPNPAIASASGTSGTALGQELLGGDKGGDHGHPADAHHAQRHQHRYQTNARATQHNPKPVPAVWRQRRRKGPLERCELVGACLR